MITIIIVAILLFLTTQIPLFGSFIVGIALYVIPPFLLGVTILGVRKLTGKE